MKVPSLLVAMELPLMARDNDYRSVTGYLIHGFNCIYFQGFRTHESAYSVPSSMEPYDSVTLHRGLSPTTLGQI